MPSPPRLTSEQTADTAPLTPEEFRAVASRCHRNSLRARALYDFTIYSVLIAIIITALWSIIAGALTPVGSAMLFGALLALILYIFTISARKDNRDIERLIKFINSTNDADMLGPILDLTNTSIHPGEIYPHMKEALDTAVLRLLPHVQPHHANTLHPAHRLRIHCWVLWENGVRSEERGLHNLPYARGALHALEQIGDKNDLAHLESLLHAVHTTEEFRAAVKHCLNIVLERVTREEGKDVLLRPERKPEASETLLRASLEQTNMQPEQLLRATAGDQGNPPI